MYTQAFQWYVSFRFPHQNPVCISPEPSTFHIPSPSSPFPFDHPNNVVKSENHEAPYCVVLQCLVTSSLLFPNIFHRILFSDTYNVCTFVNLLKPTGHVMHQQFNIQQFYVQPTLYLCVLYLSKNKQRLVPLTA